MTHLHIPDGILPVWLWLSGLLLMIALLALSLLRLQRSDARRNIPLLGALSAVMLVAMSLEILPLAYHLNLSVVTGILLGPALAFVAVFIVNLMLALIGHGGVTVIGLNTIILGTEAAVGHLLFFLLPRRLSVFWRAALATVGALFLSSLLLIAIVGLSSTDISLFLHTHDMEHAGVAETHVPSSLTRFAIMVLALGAIGWIIEGTITGAVIRFLSRVKPDLLAHALHRPGAAAKGGKAAS